MFHKVMLTGLGLTAAITAPIAIHSISQSWKGGGAKKPSAAAAPMGTPIADSTLTPAPLATASAGDGASVPVRGVAQVFRFDVTPEWIVRSWPQVSTGLAQVQLQGYRVPLVTGTTENDLAGSLTYYFNAQQQVVQIAFHGTTGDVRNLLALLSNRYHCAAVDQRPRPDGLRIGAFRRQPGQFGADSFRLEHQGERAAAAVRGAVGVGAAGRIEWGRRPWAGADVPRLRGHFGVVASQENRTNCNVFGCDQQWRRLTRPHMPTQASGMAPGLRGHVGIGASSPMPRIYPKSHADASVGHMPGRWSGWWAFADARKCGTITWRHRFSTLRPVSIGSPILAGDLRMLYLLPILAMCANPTPTAVTIISEAESATIDYWEFTSFPKVAHWKIDFDKSDLQAVAPLLRKAKSESPRPAVFGTSRYDGVLKTRHGDYSLVIGEDSVVARRATWFSSYFAP